jgi:hypothetical protein
MGMGRKVRRHRRQRSTSVFEDGEEIKNFLIHGAMFEGVDETTGEGIAGLLRGVEIFRQFNAIELANAKICMREYFGKRKGMKGIAKTFLACCIISRKFWGDDFPKTEEMGAIGTTSEEISEIEMDILEALGYSIGKERELITREIEMEHGVEGLYRKALERYSKVRGNRRGRSLGYTSRKGIKSPAF